MEKAFVSLEVRFEVSKGHTRSVLPPLPPPTDQDVALSYSSSTCLPPRSHHDQNGQSLWNCEEAPKQMLSFTRVALVMMQQ